MGEKEGPGMIIGPATTTGVNISIKRGGSLLVPQKREIINFWEGEIDAHPTISPQSYLSLSHGIMISVRQLARLEGRIGGASVWTGSETLFLCAELTSS